MTISDVIWNINKYKKCHCKKFSAEMWKLTGNTSVGSVAREWNTKHHNWYLSFYTCFVGNTELKRK